MNHGMEGASAAQRQTFAAPGVAIAVPKEQRGGDVHLMNLNDALSRLRDLNTRLHQLSFRLNGAEEQDPRTDAPKPTVAGDAPILRMASYTVDEIRAAIEAAHALMGRLERAL